MRLRADQKLFLSYLAVILAVMAAFTIGAGVTLRRHLTETVRGDLRRELYLAREVRAARDDLAPDSLAGFIGRLSGRRTTIISPAGVVLGDSEVEAAALARLENHASRAEVRAALAGREGTAVRLSRSIGVELLYMAIPVSDRTVLRLAVPLSEMNRAVLRVQQGIFGVGLIAVVLAALLSLGFSIVVTRPLRQIAEVARAMAAGDLSRRARTRHRDELGELADALDTLAGELQRRLGQLEGERAEMQALIDAMAEGVIAVGPDGTVRRANPAAQQIFGLSGDPRGLTPQEVARRDGFLRLVGRALEGGPVSPIELPHGDRHLLATSQPLPGGGAVLVFLDVSELRRLEGVRRDFVANASHELKTPLTAIRGYSETLLDDALSPVLRRQFVDTIRANADRLQRIIDDLLDLSRIESGGWRVRPEIVSISETAAEAWEPLLDEAGRRAVTLNADIPPECEFVSADPSALRQILANLFGNSLRHIADGGSVALTARCVSAPDPSVEMPHSNFASSRNPWIAIAVRDTGSGIPAAHLPRIFERFYRVDASRARSDGGTGLGLAIVRHLVEGHGGTVEAESQLGRGTTIRFTVPAAEGEAAEA